MRLAGPVSRAYRTFAVAGESNSVTPARVSGLSPYSTQAPFDMTPLSSGIRSQVYLRVGVGFFSTEEVKRLVDLGMAADEHEVVAGL